MRKTFIIPLKIAYFQDNSVFPLSEEDQGHEPISYQLPFKRWSTYFFK